MSDQIASVQRFLAMFARLGSLQSPSGPRISADTVSELGEFGMSLLRDLEETSRSLGLDKTSRQIDQMMLGVADWIIRQGGRISTLEPVVNALAKMANATDDQAELMAIADFTGRIAAACADVLRHDLDTTDRGRPWRLLHLNRGIAATRSRDVDTMRSAFDSVVDAIPLDAPRFFAEGMQEMEALDYPDHVRAVMAEYHHRFSKPLTH